MKAQPIAIELLIGSEVPSRLELCCDLEVARFFLTKWFVLVVLVSSWMCVDTQ